MTIIGIRELKAVDERFVAEHKAIAHGHAHPLAGASQRLRVEVRPVVAKGAEALVEDGVGPLALEQARHGEAHEQVSKVERVEDTGVVDHDERCHRSSCRCYW